MCLVECREFVIDEIVLERRVVVDARQVVTTGLVEDLRHNLVVVDSSPPLRRRGESGALVQQVCSDLVSRLGIKQRVALEVHVAGRHDDDGVGARALVERHRRAAAIDDVVLEPVELEVELLRLAALRQTHVGDVEAAVGEESVAHDVVLDQHLGVVSRQRQVVRVVDKQHVARVPRERVVRDPPDDVQHRRDLHCVAEVRLELVVADGEIGPVCARHQPEARLHFDRASLVRDELTVVDDYVALATVVADPEADAIVHRERRLPYLQTDSRNKCHNTAVKLSFPQWFWNCILVNRS